MVDHCKHCDKPIRFVNYSPMGKWMHYKPGSSFDDSNYEFCRITSAEPLRFKQLRNNGGGIILNITEKRN